ncbi:hypothetical protein J7K97_05295, partial [Candidatus Aerophobetes bacterium]|nr:hypothetical protein [Candidatus Aerophobetes bacterium]
MKRWIKLFFTIGLVLGVIMWCFSLGLSAREIPIEKKLVSFDFENIELEDAIRLISIKAGIDVLIEPGIKGKVTARFEKPVPVLYALSAILSPYGFTYSREGNIIRVMKKPLQLKKRTFTLKYALAQDII